MSMAPTFVTKQHAIICIVLCKQLLWFQFQEAEKKRYRAEQHRFEQKHQRQLEESRASSQAAIKELEQMQNEKRKLLMEHETLKLKELDEEYAKDIREWKAHLKPRKQVKYFQSHTPNSFCQAGFAFMNNMHQWQSKLLVY